MSNNKTILVTGGAGFIGSHTVIELVNAGYTPVIVDNFSNTSERSLIGLQRILERQITLYRLDIRDTVALEELFLRHEFQGVIHFAAFKAVGDSVEDPLSYYDNNVYGLISVLKLCEKHNVNNFVFSSSCTVYGQQDNSVVDESTPMIDAFSPYGATKQIGERILKDLVDSTSSMRVLALRYFNPIGAHQTGLLGELPIGSPNNLVPYIMQTAIGKRDHLTVFGDDYATVDGTCIRDYVHVCDVADAHVVGLNWLEKGTNSLYEVINIGTGEGNSVLEIIHTFEEVSGLKLNWQFGPRRAGDITKITAKVDKAANVLNWRAKRTLGEAIQHAWKWEQHLKDDA